MFNSSTYRKRAWDSLKENYWVLLVIIIISIVIGSLISYIPFLPLIASGILSVALTKVFIKNSYKEEVVVENFFNGMFDKWGDKVVLGVLAFLYLFLWFLLFIIPGIIKSYAYKMAFYLQYKDQLSAKDSIALSCKMMRGKKWKLFCLHLSFLGWAFLSLFTLGIGFLFLTPYFLSAEVEFFNDVYKEYNSAPSDSLTSADIV